MKSPGIVVASLALAAVGCGRAAPDAPPADEDTGWAVTAWGDRYEIFAETEGLVAGREAPSHTHVTVLADFSPLASGVVTAVLRGAGGEQRFRQDRPTRDGIFSIAIAPPAEGTFDLAFVVEAGGDREEIPAGRVRVGGAGAPGGREGATPEAAGGIAFLKEQQWKTTFATAWVEEGVLHEGLRGPARVRPARGGEVVLTATADAVVAPAPWPYAGLDVAAGEPVFRLRPRTGDRSLPELTADASALQAEVETGRRRVERLEELLRLEATSAAELERARAALVGSEARLEAARRGLAVAAGGAPPGEGVTVAAPWAGRVAQVSVSPGQAVAAGTALARLVKPRPLWIEVALRPEEAPRLSGGLAGLILERASLPDPLEIEARAVRLVAIAPEVDPATASVAVLLEVDRTAAELPIGSAVEAELILDGQRAGIVVPWTAVVDDAGIAVAYVQDSGESFSRRELRVLGRQGARVLVEGVRTGERLVTRGAEAIRRSALLSTGVPEGHVH